MTVGTFVLRSKMSCAMVEVSMGAGLWYDDFWRGFFGAVPKFRSCGGRYAMLGLDGNGRISRCQNEAEVEFRGVFEIFEDGIEVEG